MQALTDGLRAIDEADDFLPRGEALESELNTLEIARSHSTPVVRLAKDKHLSPHRALALYSKYSAERLAEAVSTEQAGSMALYGLGKTYARLATQGGDPLAGRKSAVMYQASVTAHKENYLAANELGVYLARAGRYEQAAPLLELAASHESAPSTVYANLAMVQQQIGQFVAASQTEQQQQQVNQAEFAAGAISQRHGIQWVDPAAFRNAAQATSAEPNGAKPASRTGLHRTARSPSKRRLTR